MPIDNRVARPIEYTKHTCQRCFGRGTIVPGKVDMTRIDFRSWCEMLACRRAVKIGREIQCPSCKGDGYIEDRF